MLDGWDTSVQDLQEAPRNGRIVPRPSPIGAAVVGCGYWGPNLARNISEHPQFRLQAVCDRDPSQLQTLGSRYPDAAALSELDAVLCDHSVEAVLLATPPQTHYPLAKRALEAGKHVLVEKPLATRLSDAQELADIAEETELVLMPGHTFIYSPAVNAVRDLIQEGIVGDIHFITSSRMNLGKYQSNGVVCDLAPHDLSILLYWLDQPVIGVAASGSSVFEQGVPETAFMTITFGGGTTANVQLSWLAPRKMRQMIVVGSRRMVQYDDTAADEPVRVYDRGIEVGPPTNFGEHQLTYRSGDIVSPRVEPQEPLRLELDDFAHAIRTGEEPRSNVALGLQIVAAIELAQESLRGNGVPLALAPRFEPAAA
jgi:predicted dehydrogenase